MSTKNLATPPPGQVLLLMFMRSVGISQVDLADHLGISFQRLNEIINGKRAITTETALLLGQAFRTGPEYWLDMQSRYDVMVAIADGAVPEIEPLVPGNGR